MCHHYEPARAEEVEKLYEWQTEDEEDAEPREDEERTTPAIPTPSDD